MAAHRYVFGEGKCISVAFWEAVAVSLGYETLTCGISLEGVCNVGSETMAMTFSHSAPLKAVTYSRPTNGSSPIRVTVLGAVIL